MAHFNFVISQNAKCGHAGFYIDCHRMTVPENILLQKKHCSRQITTPAPHRSVFIGRMPFLQSPNQQRQSNVILINIHRLHDDLSTVSL